MPARRPSNRRLPLSRGWRNATLVAHIVAAGAWIGIDVIVAVLVLTGRFGDDVAVRSLASQALATFVVWPMLTAGLVSPATGLILGMGTTWGLLRYWWVAVKLALNLVLCTLAPVSAQLYRPWGQAKSKRSRRPCHQGTVVSAGRLALRRTGE